MNAPIPPERDPEAIERAMLALARAAAAAGCRTHTRPAKEITPAPTTELGLLVAAPVEMSLMRAEYALMIHHARLVGTEEAGKARRRINAALFEEFDRPALQSTSKQ
jgi:hypothetical protein